ncbi:hypothetical protein [Pararhodobacter aggregans]|uniref:hypothetical protein n=1 Tax=Pararhodobacter aggregans TaxID=404875 RepID=UPI003A94084A
MLLRTATSEAHALLDAHISQLDLREAGPRAVYSRILYRGTLRVGHACQWQAAEATALMARMVEALGPDFPDDNPSHYDVPIEADAAAYVMLGSQMGLSLLRQGLAPAQRSGALALAPDTAAWTAFSQRIARCASATEATQRIVDDARRVFGIFQAEAATLLTPAAERTP